MTSQELLELAIGPLHTGNAALGNIMGFGWKREDLDIGGPPLWYRPSVISKLDDSPLPPNDYSR